MYFTSDEEKIDATLTQVVAAHVDEKLHVGVPEECGLALGARLVLHFGKRRETLTTSQVSKLSPVPSRRFCVCFGIFGIFGFERCRCSEK